MSHFYDTSFFILVGIEIIYLINLEDIYES